MSRYDADRIEIERKLLVQRLDWELDQNGSYEEWYDSLSEFRKSLGKFIRLHLGRLYWPRIWETPDGHVIDHHIIGYLAPLDFENTGWGNRRLTPSQQLIELSDFFKAKGKRFIYVSLPCKGVLHPEIISRKDFLNGKTCCTPQWRKMLRELCENGVEVIDMLPIFEKYEFVDSIDSRAYHLSVFDGSVPISGGGVFSHNHFISTIGAKVIADSIAKYLKVTCSDAVFDNKFEPDELKQECRVYVERMFKNRTSYFYYPAFYTLLDEVHPPAGQALRCAPGHTLLDEVHPPAGQALRCAPGYTLLDAGKIPYLGIAEKAKIGIFGNCNLQEYLTQGCGILSNLAWDLQCPIEYKGRLLPFDYSDQISGAEIQSLLNNDVLIYVGFPSAAFVRANWIHLRKLKRASWNTFNLNSML